MKRLTIIWMSMCVFAAVFADVQPAPAASTTTLTVQIVNGTKNGDPVHNDPIWIQVFRHYELIDTLEGAADSDGKATFENLPAADHTIIVAAVKHHNMMFKSPPLQLTPDMNPPALNVDVFEISYDESALSVDIHHIILKQQPNAIQVTEHLRMANTSDTAITSNTKDPQNRPVVLSMSLPEGFFDLQFRQYFQAGELVQTEHGFYDTLAVPPGEYDLSFSYQVPIDTPALNIKKTITLPTAGVVILAELGGLKLEGLGDPQNRLSNDSAAPTQFYKKENLKPHDTIQCTITGFNNALPKKTAWIATSAAFLCLLTLAVVRFFQKPKPSS